MYDEMMVCESCGKDLSKMWTESFRFVRGHIFCNSAHAKLFGYVKCVECGKWINPAEGHKTDVREGEQEKYVCDSCYENAASNHMVCTDCGRVIVNYSRIIMRLPGEEDAKRPICIRCRNNYSQCVVCGNWERNTLGTFMNGAYVCSSCRFIVVTCGRCHRIVRKVDAELINGTYYCDRCAGVIQNDACAEYIHPWHASKDSGTNNLKLVTCDYELRARQFIGFELEVEKDYSKTSKLDMVKGLIQLDGENRFLYETDGSLHNGFEIISRPFSEGYFRSVFNYHIKSMLDYLCERHWTSDNNSCGLHFHISREWFSDRFESEAKLLMISEKMRDVIMRLSRRDGESFNQWCRTTKLEPEDKKYYKTLVSKLKQGLYKRYRHTCVNITNETTVEFRMFRGTLDYDEFITGYDFVRFVRDFAENNTAYRIHRMTQRSFLSEARDYSPALKSYINQKFGRGAAA